MDPVINFLDKFGLGLIVISDRNYSIPSNKIDKIELTNYKYNDNTVNDNIIMGDIVINPKVKKGRWRFKSNNKTLSSWMLGLPVATDLKELERFLDEDERKKECGLRIEECKEKWDVKQSVKEYKELITKLKDDRYGER